MKKVILIGVGITSLILGIVGIFLPLFPTTPFLLLSVASFSRSSKRLYNWLINHKHLGTYIKNYHEKRGMSLRAKVISLTLLWGSIGFSILFVINLIWVRLMLFIIASGVTWHIQSLNTIEEIKEKEKGKTR